MRLTVRFYGHLRNVIGEEGKAEVSLEEGATISTLLEKLISNETIKERLLDENQEVKSDITILKNGREIRFLAGIETKLGAGDEISFFPLVVGG